MKNMKFKLISAALFLFALITVSPSAIFAQNPEKPQHQHQHPSGEEIQMQKIAFFTAELQLTPQEAEKFWPLYNQLWEERGKARRETMDALNNLKAAVESESGKGDSEIKKLSDIYLANYAMEAELLNEYFSKFEKILPVKKAAKILYAEEKFRRMLIKQLRHHPPHNNKN